MKISPYSVNKGLMRGETWRTSPYIGVTLDHDHYIFSVEALAERKRKFVIRMLGRQRTLPQPSEVYLLAHYERGMATVREIRDEIKVQTAVMGLACMLGNDLSDLLKAWQTTTERTHIPFPPRQDVLVGRTYGTTGNAPVSV